MDITLFRQLLSYEVFHYSCFAIVILLILLCALFARRRESGLKSTLVELLVGVAAIGIVWSLKVLPIIKDLNANSYVEIHASYKRSEGHSGGAVLITFGDEEMTLYLPHKGVYEYVDEGHDITASEVAFPIGEHEGTIWYSENSHHILKFTPDP